MKVELPNHYRTVVRRLIRFAAVWFVLGTIMGIVSTDYQKKLKFTSDPNGEPTVVELENGRSYTALPPGYNWEVGFDLRISHGHFVVIGSVIPLCIASTLLLLHVCGGKPISGGLLHSAFWLYLAGALSGLALIFYKGWFLTTSVLGGTYDLAAIHESMFWGSRAVRALAHALSHTILAAGMGVFAFGFWKGSETLRA
jgi:hypothetical protein